MDMMSSFNAGYVFYHKMLVPKADGTLDQGEMKKYSDKLLNLTLPKPELIKFDDFRHTEKSISFHLTTLYPGFASGLGQNHDMGNYEHNFKLGLLFDHTTGMPYISGTGIKGKIKEPFKKLLNAGVSGTKYEHHSQQAMLCYFKTLFKELELDDIDLNIDLLQKLKEEIFEGKLEGQPMAMYNRDIFLDAYITEGDPVNSFEIFKDDVIAHHYDEMRNPNIIRFLRVRSNVTFAFRFETKDSLVIEKLKAEHKEKMFKIIIKREMLGART